MRNIHELNDIIAETERFLKKAKILKLCTESSVKKEQNHHLVFGYDEGISKGWQQSKTRAAVKRSAIDLKNLLTLCNKSK